MRTYLQAKTIAKSLRDELSARHIALSHSECLEIVARQFGFGDWNILAAKLRIATTQEEPRASAITLEPPIPVLHVASLAAAKDFYVDFLGFKFDWGNEESSVPSTYAQISRDNVQLHLEGSGAGSRPTTLLFRDMRGLDALHGELNLRRSRFKPSVIQFTQWDSRVFEVVDPWGNRLRFWENNPSGVSR